MTKALTRRIFLANAGAGVAVGALARAARAEGQTPDQMLDQLIKENQETGFDSFFI